MVDLSLVCCCVDTVCLLLSVHLLGQVLLLILLMSLAEELCVFSMVQLLLHFVLLLIRRTWISLILWRLLVALAEVLGGIENLVLVQRL